MCDFGAEAQAEEFGWGWEARGWVSAEIRAESEVAQGQDVTKGGFRGRFCVSLARKKLLEGRFHVIRLQFALFFWSLCCLIE